MGKLCPGRLQHITVPLSIYNDSWQMSKLLRILSLLPFPHLKANTILFFLLFVPCLACLAKMCVTKVVLWSAVKFVIETPWFSSVKFHWTCTHFSFIHVFSPWPFNTHRHRHRHRHTHTHNYHTERQVPVSNLPYTMAIISLGRSPNYKVPRHVQQLLLCSVPMGWRPGLCSRSRHSIGTAASAETPPLKRRKWETSLLLLQVI